MEDFEAFDAQLNMDMMAAAAADMATTADEMRMRNQPPIVYAAPSYAPPSSGNEGTNDAATVPALAAPTITAFGADCMYGKKSIRIVINANDDSANVTSGDYPNMMTMVSKHRQAIGKNGAGVGHFVYENNTNTVWYVAPQNSTQYHSAVKLQEKWRALQCSSFAGLEEQKE